LETKLGSTRGTNAILERKGAHTALLVTKGFCDLLSIGTQQRPQLFALKTIKPAPLYDIVIEVNERIDAQGKLQVALLRNECQRLGYLLKRAKVQSVAIAPLNSYKNPENEQVLWERLSLDLRT
jgi:5-oxoprolinase (ATP-hydrolysing)